jgi:predicted nucleic acid-binding protein
MILTDSGFWLALINKKDSHHKRTIEFVSTSSQQFITTWPVISETSLLLTKRVGIHQQLEFIHSLSLGRAEIYKPSTLQLIRMYNLMTKYQDLPMDLADASLVLLAEELGHGKILSTDRRDYQTYRWKNHKPFKNLLFPDD